MCPFPHTIRIKKKKKKNIISHTAGHRLKNKKKLGGCSSKEEEKRKKKEKRLFPLVRILKCSDGRGDSGTPFVVDRIARFLVIINCTWVWARPSSPLSLSCVCRPLFFLFYRERERENAHGVVHAVPCRGGPPAAPDEKERFSFLFPSFRLAAWYAVVRTIEKKKKKKKSKKSLSLWPRGNKHTLWTWRPGKSNRASAGVLRLASNFFFNLLLPVKSSYFFISTRLIFIH